MIFHSTEQSYTGSKKRQLADISEGLLSESQEDIDFDLTTSSKTREVINNELQSLLSNSQKHDTDANKLWGTATQTLEEFATILADTRVSIESVRVDALLANAELLTSYDPEERSHIQTSRENCERLKASLSSALDKASTNSAMQ
eukprot:CFRG8483T1